MPALRENRTPWLAAHVPPLARDLPEFGGRKLGAPQVDLIRVVYATGLVSQSWLGRHFGVSNVAIWKIVHGRSYSDGKR